MRLVRCSLVVGILAVASLARADAPPDPLRLISSKADLVLKVEQPRQLVENVLSLEAFKKFQNLSAIHELYESTNSRRLFQLVAYLEKQFSASRLELLDRLAGGGAALAVKFKPEPVFLGVVQARDSASLEKFARLIRQIGEDELARKESKDKPVQGMHRGIATTQIGNDFMVAVLGSALALGSPAGVHSAIDLHVDGPGNSLARSASISEARKLLPPEPAAWLWLNLRPAQQDPTFKVIFDQLKDNAALPVFYGGLPNIVARAPYLCVGLYQKPGEFDLTLRFPAGRNGMPEAVAVHLPENDDTTLPLLEPPRTLFTMSYYLDLARLWERRGKLFKGNELKELEKLDKQSGPFLGGVRASKLLKQLGPHHRLVVAEQAKTGYKVMPSVRLPAAALVVDMRDPEFARTAEAMGRAGGLLATFQFNLKLVEEKHGKWQVVGYRFPEDEELAADSGKLRFNASPALVKVGNFFVISSTLELAHDLVDVLEKEASPPAYKGTGTRARAYASGAALGLRAAKDQLLTQVILGQALTPADAREQVRRLTSLVEQLGIVNLQTHYGPNTFFMDFQWKLGQ
jgi:hypothetical protein